MLKLRSILVTGLLATGIAAGGNAAVLAQSSETREDQVGEAFQERFSGGRLSFSPRSGLSNFTLRVSGPDGYHGQVFSARVAPTFRLADHGSVPDGRYSYEISAATQERRSQASLPAAGANGRDGAARPGFIGISQSGRFQVENGRIIPFETDLVEG